MGIKQITSWRKELWLSFSKCSKKTSTNKNNGILKVAFSIQGCIFIKMSGTIHFYFSYVHLDSTWFVCTEYSIPVKKIFVVDSVDLDTLSIYPNSFKVYYKGQVIPDTKYELDFASALFILNDPIGDTLIFSYKVLPLDFSKQYRLRDSSMIYSEQRTIITYLNRKYSVQDVFQSQLNKMDRFQGVSLLETIRI